MPTWRTVRVFISSTFRDMHAERDHLVKVVFPALRERLERHRVYLVDVDLRWGVTHEQAENGQVLGVCLAQVDECRPFFLGMLGERYGSVPEALPEDALALYDWLHDHPGKSVTEIEFLHGALADHAPPARAFFYLRDPQLLESVPDPHRGIFMETEPTAQQKLAGLKDRIRQSGHAVMDPYPARWDATALRLDGLDEFGETVGRQLWDAIREELSLPTQPAVATEADPLAEEADHHERFMESRLLVHVGREQNRRDLFAFAEGDATAPCLVTGDSGSGKSAILARFVMDYRRRYPDHLVVAHFIGASPRSTSPREMLRRFCLVLKTQFGFSEEVPLDPARLAVTFRAFLQRVPVDSRVLIVIDALNQLDEADRAHEMDWLPVTLPAHVKVVVSCISGTGQHLAGARPVLQAFRERPHLHREIEPLADAERREIIRAVPSLSAKTLDARQTDLLLSNAATANPLFLLVALEELRGFGSYERLTDRIAALPREGDTVTALFHQVIERLEREFDAELVRLVLIMLAAARRGLSERELQGLVSHLAGADDLFPVLHQLRPYLLSRGGLLDFYHRNLFKAIRQRFLDTIEKRRAAHAQLADFFDGQSSWLPDRQPNARKADELPWQRLRAGQAERMEPLLTDLAFLEAKVEAGLGFDLARDFRATLDAISTERRPPLLVLLEEAIRRDIHFLVRHPSTLFQCLWNSGWWYDCLEASHHYDPPEGGWPAEGPPWQRHGRKVSALLERWRAEKERAQPGFVWLRSLRPPEVALGTAQRAVFRAHEEDVTAVAFSADGHRAISASLDAMVIVWDADSGRELNRLTGHVGRVNSVSCSADGSRVVSGGSDRTVRFWDADSGQELVCLHGHEGEVAAVALSGDGKTLASGGHDNTVRVWDVGAGRERACLTWHEDRVASLGLSADGRVLASGSYDRTVRLWDVPSGHELGCLRGHEGVVTAVALSCDGRRVITGSTDKTVRVWDLASASEWARFDAHTDRVTGVACSADGGRVISASYDRTVRVWDVEARHEVACLRGHEHGVYGVACSADARLVVSGSPDKTVRVWDDDSTLPGPVLHDHGHSLKTVSPSPDGSRVISGSRDRTVRIWDAKTGRQFYCLRGHTMGVMRAVCSREGRHVVSAGGDKTVRVWDGETGRELMCLEGHEQEVSYVLVSEDGRRIVSAGYDDTVCVWDGETGERLHRLRGHHGRVNHLAWSPDGRLVASGSDDRVIIVWNIESGRAELTLRGHRAGVRWVAWSEDGKRLASGSNDPPVFVWDAATGGLLAYLAGHTERVVRVGISADGRRVVSASRDETMRTWDVETSSCIGEVAGRADAAALVMPEQYPLRAICRPLEITVEDARTGEAVAWFPADWERVTTLPDGRTWVGESGSHLSLLRVEGARE